MAEKVTALAGSDEETFQCDVCEKSLPIDDLQHSGEIWICTPCYDQWRAEFEKCDHAWVTADLEGEDGRYCSKCGGWQPV